MIWLIHPSHRKFIKLLRDKLGDDGYVVFTKDDILAYKSLWATTINSSERHMGMYKIIIQAANRQSKDVEINSIVDLATVNEIETELRKIELCNPLMTIVNTIFYFLIQVLSKYERKKHLF
jgi:hypothetical protein